MKKFLLIGLIAAMLPFSMLGESQAASFVRNRNARVRVVWRLVALTPQYQIAKAILGGGQNGSSRSGSCR